jgi:RNA polymerase sigma factor (sigma-70 family)
MPGATDDLLAWLARAADHAATTDADLLARFSAGRDEAAFAALVRRHGPTVYGVCRRLTRRAADAEDAFQATFLVLARKADRLARPERVGNYLYGVAVRVARKARRSADRRAKWERPGPALEPPAPPPTDPEAGPVVVEELTRLADRYRAAILLCDLQGKPRAEAAGLLGIPEGTLSSRLNAGRKKLADRLTRRGLAPAAGVAATATGVAEAVPPLLVRGTVEAAAKLSGAGVSANVVFLATEGWWAVGKTKLLAVAAVVAGTGAVLGWARDGGPPPATPDPKLPTPAAEAAKPAEGPKPAAGKLRITLRDELDGRANAPLWSSDGSCFAVYSNSKIHLYDVDAGLRQVAFPDRSVPLGFAPDAPVFVTYTVPSRRGPRINVEDGGNTVFSFWDLTRDRGGVLNEPARTFAYDNQSGRPVAVLSGGKSILCTTAPGNGRDASSHTPDDLYAVDTTTGAATALPVRRDVGWQGRGFDWQGVSVTRQGRVALLWHSGRSGEVELRDHSAEKTIWSVQLGPKQFDPSRGGERLMSSPDGRHLIVNAINESARGFPPGMPAAAEPSKAFFTLDATTGKVVSFSPERPGRVTTVPTGFSSDGRLFVGSAQDGQNSDETRLCVWEFPSGKLLKSWQGTAEATFSPTKPLLAIAETYTAPMTPADQAAGRSRGQTASVVGLWDVSGLGK